MIDDTNGNPAPDGPRRALQDENARFDAERIARAYEEADPTLVGAPDAPSEYGRLLAERDRLIGSGVDPDDLDMPLHR